VDINVRMGGGGGGNSRKSKISAKHTSNQSIRIAQNNNSNPLQTAKTMGRIGGSALRGSSSLLSTLTGFSAITALAMAAAKTTVDILNFASQYRQVRSGESLLESNYRAKLKTGLNLGLNIIHTEIKNTLFVQPQIVRQNISMNYERDLYNYTLYGEKNKTR